MATYSVCKLTHFLLPLCNEHCSLSFQVGERRNIAICNNGATSARCRTRHTCARYLSYFPLPRCNEVHCSAASSAARAVYFVAGASGTCAKAPGTCNDQLMQIYHFLYQVVIS